MKKADEVYIPNFYVPDIVSSGELCQMTGQLNFLCTITQHYLLTWSCYKLITTLPKTSTRLIHHLQTGDECSNDLPILWVLERQAGSYGPNAFMTWGLAEAVKTVEVFSKNYFLFFFVVSSHEDSFFMIGNRLDTRRFLTEFDLDY